MTVSRRTLIKTLALAPAASFLPRTAFAAYPDRPIHMVVPFAPGGNADIVGRLVGQGMSDALGQPVVIDNRGGAGGSIGAESVAHATPDGYTLLVGSNGPLTVNPFVQAKMAYDPMKDLAAVALTSYVPHVIIVTNSLPAKTIPELIALSQKQPVSIATSGVGSATHLTLARFNAVTGAKLQHIPYKSGGALLPDLIAGHIQAAMTEFSTALPQHKGGKARIVGIAAAHRSQLAPEVATMIEGGVKDFIASSYIGIVAPAATPAAVIASLQKSVEKTLTGHSAAADKLRNMGSEIATAEQMTPSGFGAFIKSEYEHSREAAKLAGLTPQ